LIYAKRVNLEQTILFATQNSQRKQQVLPNWYLNTVDPNHETEVIGLAPSI
jgi:hypothetical protein